MKPLPFKIPKTSQDTLIVQEDQEKVFYDKLHQHEEIQISLIVSGEGSLIVGDNVSLYRPNDILIFGSQVPHVLKSATSSSSSHMISLFFSMDSFGKDFFNLPEFKECLPFFESLDYGIKILDHQEELIPMFYQLRDTTNRLDRFILFLEMLKLYAKVAYKPISSSLPRRNYSDIEGKRIASVFTLVMQEFDREISLAEVSSLANMTPNAFCRYFKQRTNKTFFQFLTEVRIENSCSLMAKDTDLSIAQVSYSSGFKNLSNFNRKFKQIKDMTPSQFRNQLHNSHLFQ